MNPNPTSQPRTRFLVTLLVILLICVIPMAGVFYVIRSIRNFFRRLTGQDAGDAHPQADLARARRRARKAKAAYDAANRKLARASAKLAKAEAALGAVQKPTRQRAPDVPSDSKGASPSQFWIGIGKSLAQYLIQRQMRKLP
jgi:hypothetical protein